ncbi:glycosyltransferase family 39 protein [Candidatus Woesearchaeota archaeon]|nr:glycosyltransferase family 39 protein [Candidatus Woesearchaeota archaeon]
MIAEIFFWLALVAIFYLLGSRVLSKLGLAWYEKALFSVGLGTVLATLGIFYLGLLGLLYRPVFVAVAFVILLLSVSEIKSWGKIRLSVKWDLNAFLFFALALLLIGNFVMSLAPVFSIDALNYHLPIAKFYAQQHAVSEMPNNIHASIPHGFSMLYVLPELFGVGEQVPSLLAATISSLAALAVAAATYRFFSRKAAWFAGLAFASMPVFIEWASQPLVDLPIAFFSILAFYSLLSFSERQGMKWVLLFSVFASSLAFYKITALFASVAFAMAFVVWLILRYRSNFKLFARYSLTAGAVMLLVAAPWFAWVYSNTGDPVYPFLSKITRDPLAVELNRHMEGLVAEDSGFNAFNVKGILKFAVLPVLITFNPVKFDSVLGITPFFLVFLPLFIPRAIPGGKRLFAGYAVLIFFISMFAWQFTNPGLRYLLPVMAVLMPPAAYSVFWVLEKSRYRLVIAALVLLVLLFSVPVWAGIAAKRMPAAFGVVSKENYLAGGEDSNPFKALQFANNNLSEEAYVLFFRETRSYHLERKYFLSDTYFQQTLDFDEFSSAGELYAGLKGFGITHILFGKTDLARDLLGNVEHRESLMEGLMREHARVLYEDEDHRILEIT